MKQESDSDHHSVTSLSQEELMTLWKETWQTKHIPQLIKDIATGDLAQQLIRVLRKYKSTNKKMKERSAFLIENVPKLTEKTVDDQIALLTEIRSNAQVQGGGGKKAWDSDDEYEIVKESLTKFRKQVDDAKKKMNCTEEDFELSTRIALITARVLEYLTKFYREEKQKQGVTDFGDLLLLTRNLLRDNPTVRNRVSNSIDYLMVDEFQDTDPVQAEIVRMLCGEELLTGKLFLVGDAKQSIYRFRKADPKVFASLRDEIPKEGQLPLSTNFRSQPDILHFVNCLFAKPFGESYEPLVPFTTEPVSTEPNIEFMFATGDPDPALPKENVESTRKREAKWIAARISELLADETPRIWEKDEQTGGKILRRVKPGDVMILFRVMSNVSWYEEALRDAGLDYYLVGGRAFFAQQEVYDIINLCQWLDDIDDEVSLVGLLRSPWFGLTDDAIFALSQQGKMIYDGLQKSVPPSLPENQQRQIVRTKDILQELRAQKDRLPLAQLLKLALKRTGYDASLLHEFMGRRKLANLRKVIEIARSFDSMGMLTLKDFVIQMRESVTQEEREELAVTLPETGDVVRLMSIHKSKGLEFPVVIVADMNRPPKGGGSSTASHPQLGPLLSLPKKRGMPQVNPGRLIYSATEKREDEDELGRLLYVATTRAADLLILSSGLLPTFKLSSFWMNFLAKQFDITTGLPTVDPYLGTQSIGNVSPDDIPDIKIHHQEPNKITSKKTTERKQLPLSKYRTTVNETEPVPLPDLLQIVPPNLTASPSFSVSQIEVIDEALHDHGKKVVASSLGEQDSENVHATTLGSLVHEVIERINFQSPRPVAEIVQQQMNRDKESSEELKAAAIRRLTPFYKSTLFQELANTKQCYREIDFRLRWQLPNTEQTSEPITIVGEIDALVLTPNGQWKMYDYKTGRLTSKDAELLLQHYEIQLGLYCFACRELLGEFPDEITLVLLQPDKVEHVLFLPTDEKMNELRERINLALNAVLTQSMS